MYVKVVQREKDLMEQQQEFNDKPEPHKTTEDDNDEDVQHRLDWEFEKDELKHLLALVQEKKVSCAICRATCRVLTDIGTWWQCIFYEYLFWLSIKIKLKQCDVHLCAHSLTELLIEFGNASIEW